LDVQFMSAIVARAQATRSEGRFEAVKVAAAGRASARRSHFPRAL